MRLPYPCRVSGARAAQYARRPRTTSVLDCRPMTDTAAAETKERWSFSWKHLYDAVVTSGRAARGAGHALGPSLPPEDGHRRGRDEGTLVVLLEASLRRGRHVGTVHRVRGV